MLFVLEADCRSIDDMSMKRVCDTAVETVSRTTKSGWARYRLIETRNAI